MDIIRTGIALIAGAVIAVLMDWLLKPLLPSKPKVKHIIAAVIAIFALLLIALWPQIDEFFAGEKEKVSLDILETRNYFPFYIGSSWSYNISHTTDAGTISLGKYTETVMSIETGLGDKAQIIEVQMAGEELPQTCPINNKTLPSMDVWYVLDDTRIFQVCSKAEANTIASYLIHGGELDPFTIPEYIIPLDQGYLWSAFPDIAPREDTAYQWYVDSIVDVSVPAGQYKDCYRILLYTLPDDTIKWVCKGIGLVAWEYHHHGSKNDYRAELSEYRKSP